MLHRGNTFATVVTITGLLVGQALGCGDSEGDGGGADTTSSTTTATGQTTGNGATTTSNSSTQSTSSTGGMGMPIDAPENTWTWIDFPDSKCMDGSPTGIGVNLSSTSENVAIFLQGGNACFNLISCNITANTDGYGEAEFQAEIDSVGGLSLLDRTGNSPIKDYSFIYVPYCSGDVFAGNKADVVIGPNTWQFNGFNNITAFLNRIVPTFPNAQKVLLTGVSAGGFGAAYNYDHVASAFPNADVTLIDDSGPPMGAMYVAPCLQQHFIDTWGVDTTLPQDCADCKPADGAFIEPYVNHIKTKFPAARFGVISSEADATIRRFWGYGEDCTSLPGAPPPYAAAKYTAGLEDIRDRMFAGNPNFALFMLPGDEHVWLDNDPTTVVVDTTNLETWLTQALTGDAAWASHPAP